MSATIQKIDHLGIAVKSIDAALPYYEKTLGLKCEHREEVPSQKVRTAFFACGEVHIELLEPTDPESTIAKFIADIKGVSLEELDRITTNNAVEFFGLASRVRRPNEAM